MHDKCRMREEKSSGMADAATCLTLSFCFSDISLFSAIIVADFLAAFRVLAALFFFLILASATFFISLVPVSMNFALI